VVGRTLSQVLVRYPVVTATLPDPLTTRSQETTVRRCRQGLARRREGVVRRIPTPQGVFRRHQRVDQALRCVSPYENNRSASFNDKRHLAIQGCER